MILLTRLNGVPFAVNADLIERVETVPDTVVTLVDGHKYVVSETADEVIERVLQFRASILVTADHIQHGAGHSGNSLPNQFGGPASANHPTNRKSASADRRGQLRVVTDGGEEA